MKYVVKKTKLCLCTPILGDKPMCKSLCTTCAASAELKAKNICTDIISRGDVDKTGREDTLYPIQPTAVQCTEGRVSTMTMTMTEKDKR